MESTLEPVRPAPRNRRLGTVFNVQPYSIHDGPGIRTTVFMKGCPLRCTWCQNPESQILRPEVFFASEKCLGCGKCVSACREHAISLVGDRSTTNRDLCRGHGDCVAACPNGARTLMGRALDVEQAAHEVLEDLVFYKSSGGGVTLSGGEPLAQASFAERLLKRCRDAGVHTTLDTCGYAPWKTVERVLRHVDLVLYDLKHMDSHMHREATGVGNELILENARRIHHELGVPLRARIPIIPGFNDSDDNLRATARFISQELSAAVPVHLNAFHRYGEAKYTRLDRVSDFAAAQPPSEATMAEYLRLFESFGLKVQIGG